MSLAFEREVSLDGLDAFAADLLKKAKSFPNICLYGDLGAGKTTLVKKLCEQLGIDSSAVTSPTFTYMQTYDISSPSECGPFKVHHFDLYRIENEEDFEMMGWMDYFQSQPKETLQGVTLIEWPSKVQNLLPLPRLDVELEYAGSKARKVSVYERV